jgi:hypothetical protein
MKFFGNKAPVIEYYKLHSDAVEAYEYNREYYGAEFAGARLDHPWATIDKTTDIFCEVL